MNLWTHLVSLFFSSSFFLNEWNVNLNMQSLNTKICLPMGISLKYFFCFKFLTLIYCKKGREKMKKPLKIYGLPGDPNKQQRVSFCTRQPIVKNSLKTKIFRLNMFALPHRTRSVSSISLRTKMFFFSFVFYPHSNGFLCVYIKSIVWLT